MKINYIHIFLVVCFQTMIVLSSFGQWSEAFNTNDLSNWSGDVGEFIVNGENELQLNASSAGEVFIYRESLIDFDSITLTVDLRMDFAPSDNNQTRLYLALDNENVQMANGYFIIIGENGANDALNFFALSEGQVSFIASASMGAMASEPATVKLRIDIFENGLWSIYTDYEEQGFPQLELEFMDDQFDFKESQFFGIECKFSSSRADKFFFDDLSVLPFMPDTTPPVVNSVTPQNENSVLVTFSEPVFEGEATYIENYTLNVGSENPSGVESTVSLGSQYLLTFDNDFDASQSYALNVSGISDLSDNQMQAQSVSFLFADKPEKGELFLSEILFDPYPNGEDFIELYNGSNKNLDLNGVKILNTQNEEIETMESNIILPPKSYIAFSEDVDFLVQEYKPESDAVLVFQELPAFNNESGNLSLINAESIVLETFDYNEDLHFQLIDDTEGVSLERISFEIESNTESNWQSAAQNVRFATPGYANSNSILTGFSEEQFFLSSEVFSPNQDGDNDQMVLNYNLEKSGFLASIQVYDAAGFQIKQLTNNVLLGNQGIIVWDGTNTDNQLVDLGIYIIAGQAFHPDGEVIAIKLTTVLGDFID